MIYGYIYRIKNNDNDKCYIGATTQGDPETRWVQHKCDARNNRHYSLLSRAINKYGEDRFSFHVMAKCSNREEMNLYERAFISLFNSHVSDNGYNIQWGGDFSGKHSDKTKQKMSDSWYKSRLKTHVEPVVKYDLEGNKIQEFDSILEAQNDCGSTGGDISQICQGKQLTYKGFTYRYNGDEFDKYPVRRNTSKRPVLQVDTNTGDVINEFSSIADANRYLGKERNPNISRVCRKLDNYETAYGFNWKYKNEVVLR